jgi:hypothetical protein
MQKMEVLRIDWTLPLTRGALPTAFDSGSFSYSHICLYHLTPYQKRTWCVLPLLEVSSNTAVDHQNNCVGSTEGVPSLAVDGQQGKEFHWYRYRFFCLSRRTITQLKTVVKQTPEGMALGPGPGLALTFDGQLNQASTISVWNAVRTIFTEMQANLETVPRAWRRGPLLHPVVHQGRFYGFEFGNHLAVLLVQDPRNPSRCAFREENNEIPEFHPTTFLAVHSTHDDHDGITEVECNNVYECAQPNGYHSAKARDPNYKLHYQMLHCLTIGCDNRANKVIMRREHMQKLATEAVAWINSVLAE